jgi:hypothetical protein
MTVNSKKMKTREESDVYEILHEITPK